MEVREQHYAVRAGMLTFAISQVPSGLASYWAGRLAAGGCVLRGRCLNIRAGVAAV